MNPISFSPQIGRVDFIPGGREKFEAHVLDRQIEHSARVVLLAVLALVIFLIPDWLHFNSYWKIDYAIYVWLVPYAAVYGLLGWGYFQCRQVQKLADDEASRQRKRKIIWLITITANVLCVVSTAVAWVYGSEQTAMGFVLSYYLISFLFALRDRVIFSVFFALFYTGVTAVAYFVLPGSALDLALNTDGHGFRVFDTSLYFDNLITGFGLNLFLNYIGLVTYRWAANAYNQSLISDQTINDLVQANAALNEATQRQTDTLHRICQELKLPTPKGLNYGELSDKIKDLSLENARSVRRLKEANDNFNDFIERTRDGVIELGPRGECRDANPAMLKLLEMPIEQFRNLNAIDLIAPEDREHTNTYFRQLRDQGYYSEFVVHIHSGRGNTRILQVSGSAIYNRNGEFAGSRNIARDITQQREQEDALLAARSAEKHFLARISHEIRTPLNAIIGITHLLSDTRTDERQREYVEILDNASQFLLNLLNGMLDMAKIQSGQMELNPRLFSPREVLTNLHKTFSFKVKDKPVDVKLELDPQLPEKVYGDEFVLTQILFNLIGNADKFTREGHITIRADVALDTKDKVTLQFSVTDSGIGIAPEDQERIFNQFAQVKSANHSGGGTGLGLALCQEFVTLLDGDIRVDSDPGEGSTFTVTIPYDHADKAPQGAEEPPANGQRRKASKARAKGKRVLVAEDSAFNMLYIQTLLENNGMIPSTASDGQKALELAAQEAFDLILMDLNMPQMDGLEAARAIRDGDGPNRNTPIVALTASVLAEHRQLALNHGMNDFLAKPFTPEQLRALVQRIFG